MDLTLLTKLCLAMLLCTASSTKKWHQSIRSHTQEAEVQRGTTNNCDNASSFLSTVPACSSPYCCDNGTCKCADTEEILCSPSLIQAGYCVTFDEAQTLTQLGQCVYNNVSKNTNRVILLQYYSLPSNVSELNDVMCGPFNRTGMLCGKCKDGYYPLNSLDVNCEQCPNGWSNLWKFVMVVFLPLTVFYFIILLFRVNATSSQLHGFMFCCQGIALPSIVRFALLYTRYKKGNKTVIQILGVLYGIWNLDFLRSVDIDICLPVDTLTALALDVAVGIYPLLLILITYFLIKLYDRNFTPLEALCHFCGPLSQKLGHQNFSGRCLHNISLPVQR